MAFLLPLLINAPPPKTVERGQGTDHVKSAVVRQDALSHDASGHVIKVGLHVRNIYGLSLIDQSFLADGWYWLEWGPDVQAALERWQIEPDQIIEFANEIELAQYSSRQPSVAHAANVRPGRYRHFVRFSGKFYLHEVPQRFAPFDPQRLKLDLEVEPDVLSLGPDRVWLEPADSAATIVGESVSVSGYELESVSWQQSNILYPVEFQGKAEYSRLTAIFVYGKSEWAVFLKWIFPIIIVMAIVVLSPSIEGVLGDIRIAIPPSALLTLVVQQDGYKSSFPPAPYLTYLDELYVYSYFVCLAVFLLFLVGTNAHTRATDQSRDKVGRWVNHLDAVVQVSAVIGFVLVAIGAWYT